MVDGAFIEALSLLLSLQYKHSHTDGRGAVCSPHVFMKDTFVPRQPEPFLVF